MSRVENCCHPGRSARMAARPIAWASALRVRRVDRHLAAALALAAVLAGAAAVARLTATLALACVLPCAVVRGHLGHVGGLVVARERNVRELRARDQSARDAQHDLTEITTIHS